MVPISLSLGTIRRHTVGRRFAAQLEQQGVGSELAVQTAWGVARSLCGVACWPRLVLDDFNPSPNSLTLTLTLTLTLALTLSLT